MSPLKLSFIIPIYNGAKYIKKCLDSLLEQDIPKSDYEIICVNDLSSDNSINIIAEYKKKYSNIVLINHKENLKVATACNTGLLNAKGKYCWFLGQDDWIKTNSLSKIMENLEQNSLDIFLFNYQRVNENGDIIIKTKVFENSETMNGIDFIQYYFGSDFVYYLLGYTWRAVIRTDLIKEEKIYFRDGLTFEDTVFLLNQLFFLIESFQ